MPLSIVTPVANKLDLSRGSSGHEWSTFPALDGSSLWRARCQSLVISTFHQGSHHDLVHLSKQWQSHIHWGNTLNISEPKQLLTVSYSWCGFCIAPEYAVLLLLGLHAGPPRPVRNPSVESSLQRFIPPNDYHCHKPFWRWCDVQSRWDCFMFWTDRICNSPSGTTAIDAISLSVCIPTRIRQLPAPWSSQLNPNRPDGLVRQDLFPRPTGRIWQA